MAASLVTSKELTSVTMRTRLSKWAVIWSGHCEHTHCSASAAAVASGLCCRLSNRNCRIGSAHIHTHNRQCAASTSQTLLAGSICDCRLPSAARTTTPVFNVRSSALSAAGQAAWNSLPNYLHDSSRSFDSFCQDLKTSPFLFYYRTQCIWGYAYAIQIHDWHWQLQHQFLFFKCPFIPELLWVRSGRSQDNLLG